MKLLFCFYLFQNHCDHCFKKQLKYHKLVLVKTKKKDYIQFSGLKDLNSLELFP